MSDLALVLFGLILGFNNYEFLYVEITVVISGDHGRAVVGCFLSYEDGGACHMIYLLGNDLGQ